MIVVDNLDDARLASARMVFPLFVQAAQGFTVPEANSVDNEVDFDRVAIACLRASPTGMITIKSIPA